MQVAQRPADLQRRGAPPRARSARRCSISARERRAAQRLEHDERPLAVAHLVGAHEVRVGEPREQPALAQQRARGRAASRRRSGRSVLTATRQPRARAPRVVDVEHVASARGGRSPRGRRRAARPGRAASRRRAPPARRDRGRPASVTTRSAHAEHVGVVGDDDRRAARAPARRSGPSSASSASRVQAGGRLVEHEHRRVAHERAGDREALALAAGERAAALAEPRVVAVGQRRDERRARPPRARPPRSRRRVAPGRPWAIASRTVTSGSSVSCSSSPTFARTASQRQVAQVVAVERAPRPRRGRRSAGAAARASTCPRRSARRAPRSRRARREVDPGQRVARGARVAEARRPRSSTSPRARPSATRARALDHRRALVEQLEHPLGAGRRGEDAVGQARRARAPGRRAATGRRGRRAARRASASPRVSAHVPSAMTTSTPSSSIRSTSGENSAADPRRGELGLDDPLALVAEARDLGVAAVERLHERRVGERLLGDRAERAVAAPLLARGVLAEPREVPRDEEEQRRRRRATTSASCH